MKREFLVVEDNDDDYGQVILSLAANEVSIEISSIGMSMNAHVVAFYLL